MWNAGLDESQTGIKITKKNISNLRYADDTTLMAVSKEELKSLLIKVKEESEKAGLKLNFQKANIIASSPITSWQIDGEKIETVADFIFLDSKINVDGDCSHEIKRCRSLEEKLKQTFLLLLPSMGSHRVRHEWSDLAAVAAAAAILIPACASSSLAFHMM